MRLLFVCSGNMCRSPLAERLTRALLDRALGPAAAEIGTASAGTIAVVGSPMDAQAAFVLRELDGDPDGFAARQLTAAFVTDADLVLTMARHHREDVLALAPGALRRTFTLAEAAELVGQADRGTLPPAASLTDRGRALTAALHAARATRAGTDRSSDDIFDPIGGSRRVHQGVGRRIQEAIVPLVETLCATRVAAPSWPTERLHAPA